jgi:hypothetical protein
MGDPTIYPAGETMGIRIIEPTSYIVNTGDTFTYTVTFPKKETVYGVFLWGVFSPGAGDRLADMERYHLHVRT